MPRFAITPIARSGGRFASFGPYVPSVNAKGEVAFQASLVRGGSAIAMGDGHAAPTIVASDADFHSHPAIAETKLSAYADGRVLWTHDQATQQTSREALLEMGPLGPTMNARGEIALRGRDVHGEGIFVARGKEPTLIANTRDFLAFHGLPVITRDGSVVFRADRSGGPCIVRWRGALEVITGEEFVELGRFPSADDARVAFVGTREDGTTGVFVAENGALRHIEIAQAARFQSFRGALIAGPHLVFYASSAESPLGIYAGREGALILALGDALLGSTVEDFALNPVSIHANGHLAVRIRLADRSEHILRIQLG